MKIILVILVSAGIAFGAGYVVVSSQKEAGFKKERERLQAEWDTTKAQLEADLAAAKKRSRETIVTTVTEPAAVEEDSPEAILEKLINLRPGGAGNTRAIRQVVHHLESLAERGPAALPAIRAFLARNQDIDYAIDGREDGDGERGGGPPWSWRRGGDIRTDFVLPPSLRLGLVDVLKQIGGEESEKILAEMLATSGRGVEVAYVARVLEEMSPGKYRELALNSAKDLLMNPLAIDNPNRLDEQAKGYLFSVLRMYNDTSFAYSAQSMLVTEDGRIDRSTLNYINSTLKEQAVPMLYQAYQDTRITNQFDKASLASQVLNYAGMNAQANSLFNEIVTNTNLDARLRGFTVIRLAGGNFGPFGSETPTDPNVIRARQQLVNSMMTTATDETLQRSLTLTSQNLQNLLDGKPVQSPFEGRGPDGGRFGGRGRDGGRQGTQQ